MRLITPELNVSRSLLLLLLLDHCVRGSAGGRGLHADGVDRAGAVLGLGEGHGHPRHQEEGGPGKSSSSGRIVQAIQVINNKQL